MAQRVTVHHLTATRRLPLIEEQGLRTRGELSRHLGEPGALDIALVYALLNFLLSIAISKFSVERGGVL